MKYFITFTVGLIMGAVLMSMLCAAGKEKDNDL